MQIGEALEEKQKTVQENLIICEEELEESRNEAKRLQFKVKQAESNLRDLELEDINNAKRMNTLQRRVNQSIRAKQDLDKAITSQELEDRVEELYVKQTDFWTALEGQIKVKQADANEYMAGLGASLSSDRVIEKMQLSIQGTTFNQEAVDIRGIMNNYEHAIKDICKKKIEGTFVSSHELQKPKYLLDHFLFKPHIERMWNIQ